jgi:exodeoxyribonuclease VII small subunit
MVRPMATRKKAGETKGDTSTDSAETAEVLSFEEAMGRLSEIVEELEAGELNLEVSLKRFEEGIQLARKSQARLDEAEAKVEELLGFDDEGSPITEEI